MYEVVPFLLLFPVFNLLEFIMLSLYRDVKVIDVCLSLIVLVVHYLILVV